MSKRVTYLFLALIASFSLLGCGSDVPTSLSPDGSITPPTDDNVGPPTDEKPPTDEIPPPPPENPINGLYTSSHYFFQYLIIDDIDNNPFIAAQNSRNEYVVHGGIIKETDKKITSSETLDGDVTYGDSIGYTKNMTTDKGRDSSFTLLADGGITYKTFRGSNITIDYKKAVDSLSLKELNGTHNATDGATYTINEIDASLTVDAKNGCNFSGTLTLKNGMYTMPSVQVTKCTNTDAYLNGTYKGFMYTDVKADGTKYMMINMRNDKDTIWARTPLK